MWCGLGRGMMLYLVLQNYSNCWSFDVHLQYTNSIKFTCLPVVAILFQDIQKNEVAILHMFASNVAVFQMRCWSADNLCFPAFED